MMNKIFGYVLLIIGILIIGWAVFRSFAIFTAKASAPMVFKTPSFQDAQNGAANDAQRQVNDAVRQQLNQIIPADGATRILNLVSWSLFASILIIAGGTISGIGVKLIK